MSSPAERHRRPRVGMVINRVEDYSLRVIDGLREVLGAGGASLLVLIHPSAGPGDGRWLQRLVAAGTVDAVVLSAVTEPATGASAVQGLVEQARGVPVVSLCAQPTVPEVPSVCADGAAGVHSVAAHLLDGTGRVHPLVVSGPADNADALERETAFAEAVAQRGLELPPGSLVRAGFDRDSAYRRTLEVLEAGLPVDAVFAANDEMALGVMDALAARGFRVPEDVTVAGFDDTVAGSTAPIPLTSVDQQLEAQGRRAAHLVLALLAGEQVPAGTRTACGLVVRASSSASLDAVVRDEEVDGRARDAALSASLHHARTELLLTQQLLGTSRALANALTEGDVVGELGAWLPRLAVRRAFLVRVRAGSAHLLGSWGATGTSAGPVGLLDDSYPAARLLPSALQDELSRGALVVRHLELGAGEAAVLLYEQAQFDRHTGEALPQDVARALTAVRRTRESTDHAAELERLVAERTAQLQAEVGDRRAAQEELSRVNAGLQRALLTDGLTGLANRPGLDAALADAWREHARSGAPLSVLVCDIDHFKAYNDAAGHLAGDRCLREVAAALASSVRGPHDTVARYGGEEFSIVLPATGPDVARRVADRVMERIRGAALPHPGLRTGAVVSISIGVASVVRGGGDVRDGLDVVDVLHAADAALYRAKALGRARVEVAAPLSACRAGAGGGAQRS